MSNPLQEYAVVGIFRPGETKATLMAANRRVIVFDNYLIAQQFAPLLGCGRRALWSRDRETVCFVPLVPSGINRAVILHPYDLYSLPPGLPVRSETRGMEWRHHVIWSLWWTDQGQMAERPDGTYANQALEERGT